MKIKELTDEQIAYAKNIDELEPLVKQFLALDTDGVSEKISYEYNAVYYFIMLKLKYYEFKIVSNSYLAALKQSLTPTEKSA